MRNNRTNAGFCLAKGIGTGNKSIFSGWTPTVPRAVTLCQSHITFILQLLKTSQNSFEFTQSGILAQGPNDAIQT